MRLFTQPPAVATQVSPDQAIDGPWAAWYDAHGAEIDGRLRRGEGKEHERRRWRLRGFIAIAAALLMITAVLFWPARNHLSAVTVDRCCYDLDGGGKPDDGLHIEAGKGERVRRVAIYEDLDGSVSFTPNDLVRYQSP